MNSADIPQHLLTHETVHRSGTRSLSRALKLARVVASRPVMGWRLADLAVACDLDRGTVHRMLACMVAERFVEQRATDRHYLPGPLMFELGLALPQHTRYHQNAQAIITQLAHRMCGVVIFLLRSGNEFVCSARAGACELAGAMVHVGARRPLITSAGGVAILQTLDAGAQHVITAENVAQEIKRHGTSRLDGINRMLSRSAHFGFGVNLGDVASGLHAFGVPVRDKLGETFAGLCLIGPPERYGESRIDELHHVLSQVATDLQAFAA